MCLPSQGCCPPVVSMWLLEGRDQPSSLLAAFSKGWLIIPLCTFVSEKGTWPLGSLWCSPESVSWLKGT